MTEYWAHPTREGVYVRADGYDQLYESRRPPAMLDGVAVIAWPDHAKIAAPLPYDAEKVLTARNVVLDRKEALRAGFKICDSDQDGRATASSWRSAIYALAEARERPAATAELLTSQTSETFTVDQARAFLRGLPVETEHPDTTEETIMTTNDDPRAARLAEIRQSMNAFNKSNGYAAKSVRADAKDFDPAKLKRLAEIKYSALHASGKGMTQEAKLIRLALDTHDKIGTPLIQTLAQLGVDVSTLIPAT